MKMITFCLLFACVFGKNLEDPGVCKYNKERDEYPGGKFPRGFKWSLATAAYQIEGSPEVRFERAVNPRVLTEPIFFSRL